MARPTNTDAIFNHAFQHTRKLARNFYFKQWAKSPPQCPAFNGEVIAVGHHGWQHTNKSHRTKIELLNRYFCLEKAKLILETAPGFQRQRTIGEYQYWIFDQVIEEVRLEVVVRSFKKQKKHFYSLVRKGTAKK